MMKFEKFSPSIIFISLSIILVFGSCQRDDEPKGLDASLEKLLADNSNGLGTAYFAMPQSHQLDEIPQDPNNLLSAQKVALGKLLFHETALGINPKNEEYKGTYSCASCHHAQGGFQACRSQGIGDGGLGFGTSGMERFFNEAYTIDQIDVQPLRSPSVLNIAYQPNVLWNGQFGATGVNEDTKHLWTEGTPLRANYWGFEGAETQSIAGMDVHRLAVNKELLESLPGYLELFDEAFGDFPEETRYSKITAGLAIAAYERTLLATESPFQQWLAGDIEAMSNAQKEGAMLFFGKAQCGSCHTGPALNSMEFHALGMNNLEGNGVLEYDPENKAHLGRGGFTGKEEDMHCFKVPQLYNLKDSPFYGHGSSFTSVREIIEYKNEAQAQNPMVAAEYLDDTFQPLNLTEIEIDQIEDFISNALYDPNLTRFVPDALLSGNCFPNNDTESKTDLGCE